MKKAAIYLILIHLGLIIFIILAAGGLVFIHIAEEQGNESVWVFLLGILFWLMLLFLWGYKLLSVTVPILRDFLKGGRPVLLIADLSAIFVSVILGLCPSFFLKDQFPVLYQSIF